MEKVLKSYETHSSKQLQVMIAPGTAHYVIKYEGGGNIPNELSGAYTSLTLADIAIKNYLLTNTPVEKLDEGTKAKERYLKKKAKEEVDGTEE